MKYLIVSDIHGAYDSVEFILDKFNKEKCDYILLLGDVLYHGPRNDLPNNYAPKKCIELLNPYSDKIICVKGNCEAEVDQMVLKFKILDSYDEKINDILCHLEHGHHLDLYNGNAKLVLYGHTHIPDNTYDERGFQRINPGSITIPKNNSKRGYAIWEDSKITLYTIDNEVISSYNYKK